MQVDIKIFFRNSEGRSFMGNGLVWLLGGIERHHSISSAAREMDLSYPKALRMIKNLERGLGQPIVIRHKGGNERGGAELTPMGRDFLRRYEKMQTRIKRYATETFEKIFTQSLAKGDFG